MDDSPPTRILLVEDDVKLAELMRDFLQTAGGYAVEMEHRGDAAVERVLRERPDLVVLDIMLPGKDGLTVCRELRPRFDGPIIMLTALGDEIDEVVGLELGADDYLAKPSSPRRLLARIKSLLRRVEVSSEGTATPADGGASAAGRGPQRIELGGLDVDASSRRATLQGAELELTTGEFDLLWLLASRAGEVLSRDEIYQALRGIEWDGLDRSVDQRVVRLRRKLGDDARHPSRLKSVRGTGYLLAVTP